MSLALFPLFLFCLIMAVAVYVHTVTGFGLAMIVMGLASGLGVYSVATMATVISVVTLLNSAVALRGNVHHVPRGATRVMALAVLPSSVLGVLLLDYLSADLSRVVQVLLGLVIIYGGVSMAWRPEALTQMSGRLSFAWYGFVGGLIGGLFSIPGPPLIYQLYRQPLSMAQIRNALIFLNAVIAGARTLFVAWQGGIQQEEIVLSAVTLPVVALATVAGMRWLPPFSLTAMRRLAFILLVVMGVALIIPVLW